jgi:anaphase-promoting complex subunit 1
MPAAAREMAPPIGSRQLTVLREFRPHGLAAEEADGGGPEARPLQDYDYFLFDPSLAASPRPAPGDEAASSSSGADGDHELFIRGNQYALPSCSPLCPVTARSGWKLQTLGNPLPSSTYYVAT